MEDQTIFKSLQEARCSKRLTQAQLSKILGLGQSYISQVEQGKQNIGIKTLMEWARTLDLEVMLIPRQQVPPVLYLIKAGSPDLADLPAAYGPLPDEVK